MRTVSATTMEAILAQQTDQVFLTTLRISHPDLNDDLLFVNDTAQHIMSGETYLPAGFEFRLPDDVEDNVPRGQILLDNVDQQIIQVVRPLNVAPSIEVNIVRVDDPPVVELGPIEFELQEFSYDAHTIRGQLGYAQDFLTEGFPRDNFNPRTAPGLF